MSRKTLATRFCASILLCCAVIAGAVDLTANRTEIAVGENVTVKLKNPPAFSEVEWIHTPGLTRLEAGRDKLRLRGVAAGVATVTVLINGHPEANLSVRVIDVAAASAPLAMPLPAAMPSQPDVAASPVYTPALPDASDQAGRDYSSPVQVDKRVAAWPAPTPATAAATPAPSFTLTQTSQLTLIQTYHWNNGQGAYPGSIALIDDQGRQHGPWPAVGTAGPGAVANVYWQVQPMLTLPTGRYTVVDSDPSTWTPDPQNGGRGFSRHETLPVRPDQGPTGMGMAVPAMPAGTLTYPGYTGSGGWAQPATTSVAPAMPGIGQARPLFDIGNNKPVVGNPEKPSKLDLNTPHVITLIRTYHWNEGRGAYPGNIGLRCRDGSNHGPWQARGETGPDGVANAYWSVQPNVQLPACVCSVVVSDPPSWSQNEASKKRGFVHIEGYPIGYAAGGYRADQAGMTGDSAAGTTLEALDRAHEAVRKMDETKRALESLKSIFK